MLSDVSPEKRVPAEHPPVREMVDEILKGMSPRFARLYAEVGRPSIAPERLLRDVAFPAAKTNSAATPCGFQARPKTQRPVGQRSRVGRTVRCRKAFSRWQVLPHGL